MNKRTVKQMISLRKRGVSNRVVLQTMIELELNKVRLAEALEFYMEEVVREQGQTRTTGKVEENQGGNGNSNQKEDNPD